MTQELHNPELKVGTRCSYRIWTDVVPVVVVERQPKMIRVKELPFWRKPGAEPMTQAWVIGDEPTNFANEYVFTLRKNGRWKLKGVPIRDPGCVLEPGCRRYYDYSF